MTIAHDKLRQAAILVAALDMHTADALLEQMPADDAARVRRMITDLGDVDPGEQESAIAQFLGAGSPPRGQGSAHHAAREPRARQLDSYEPSPAPTAPPEAPFRFLHEAECESLVPLLAAERPQTIALVVSHLPEARALRVIAALPAAMQAEVVRRWIDLDQADPAILREVERGLESRIVQCFQADRRRAAGLSHVARIMEAADPQVKRQILANLSLHDATLAAQLNPQRLEFADLEFLDDQKLAAVLQAADPEVTLLALAGASPGFLARIMANLPAAEAKLLRRSLANLGPTRLTDVEQAGRELARLAESHDAEGLAARSASRAVAAAA